MDSQSLCVVSGNSGKIKEFQELFNPISLIGLSIEQAHRLKQVQEDGASYEENALLKARPFLDAIPHTLVADDSGIEVECLGGEPGLLSARYGQVGWSDEQKRNRLFEEAQQKSEGQIIRARFVCVLVSYVWNDSERKHERIPLVGRGMCHGILGQARGMGGFGYDPIFYPDGFYGRSMAELTISEKNAISHRAIAVKQLLNLLKMG